VTDDIANFNRGAAPTIHEMLQNRTMIDYATYAKFRGKIRMQEGEVS